MSDIPTSATGVHVVGASVYLFDRTGVYIAQHSLADDEASLIADPRQLAAEWLATIGYRINDGDWAEHCGWIKSVQYAGFPTFEWSITSPDHYLGIYNAHSATVWRTREGTWTVVVDLIHAGVITTTRGDAKRAADVALRSLVCTLQPHGDIPEAAPDARQGADLPSAQEGGRKDPAMATADTIGRERRESAYTSWRQASTALEARTTIENSRIEEHAWEIYTDECDLIGECVEPGCHATTPEHVYCPTHQPQWA